LIVGAVVRFGVWTYRHYRCHKWEHDWLMHMVDLLIDRDKTLREEIGGLRIDHEALKRDAKTLSAEKAAHRLSALLDERTGLPPVGAAASHRQQMIDSVARRPTDN
jgi:hypothetical protein